LKIRVSLPANLCRRRSATARHHPLWFAGPAARSGTDAGAGPMVYRPTRVGVSRTTRGAGGNTSRLGWPTSTVPTTG